MPQIRPSKPHDECTWCVLVFEANRYRVITWCETKGEAKQAADEYHADDTTDPDAQVFVLQSHYQTADR